MPVEGLLELKERDKLVDVKHEGLLKVLRINNLTDGKISGVYVFDRGIFSEYRIREPSPLVPVNRRRLVSSSASTAMT